MKKIFLILFVTLMALSCTVEDGNKKYYYYEILPIDSFEIPESFELGKVYTLSVFYKKPNDCHENAALYYEKNDSIRIIAIQSQVIDKNNCIPFVDEEATKGTFEFEATGYDSYIFKFFKGTDENGVDTFEEVTIPVIN